MYLEKNQPNKQKTWPKQVSNLQPSCYLHDTPTN